MDDIEARPSLTRPLALRGCNLVGRCTKGSYVAALLAKARPGFGAPRK
jgi:hypothetical protein